jgi:hypothetical protein
MRNGKQETGIAVRLSGIPRLQTLEHVGAARGRDSRKRVTKGFELNGQRLPLLPVWDSFSFLQLPRM